MLQRLSSVLRALLRRREFERCMDDELRFHVERYAEDLVRSGLSQEEAARRARIEFGAANSIAGECREARGLALFDELARNLRYTLRVLKKSPVFTATALLTLALCLGANLAIFAVVDSILLRPLPFPDAGRLVTIFNTYPKAGVERDGSSLTNYYERRGRIPAFSSLSIYRFGTAIVGEAGSTAREEVTQVSPDFFATLQTGPIAGRVFTDRETTFKTDDVVIITDAYRRQHFDGDAHVIGHHIRVNGAPKTVIGVLPPGFRFLSSPARLYFPLASRLEDRGPSERHSGGNVIQMIARLRPGATVAQAQSQIDAQNAALERDDPQAKLMADAGFRSLVVPLHADQVASVQPVLLLLQAFVLLLLVIGIVNLINLLLIRANGRMRELAMRQALGARGTHIVIDAIVETMLLALTGGIAGIAVGAAGVRLLTALGADHLPLGNYIALAPRLIAVELAASAAIGALLALPVAYFELRHAFGRALHADTWRGTVGPVAQRLRYSFLAAQLALAFVLISGTGLLGLSLERAMAVSPGFRPDHVLTGEISLVGHKYPSAQAGLAFTERLLSELRRQPGVLFSGIAVNIPFSGKNGKSAATVVGHVLRPGESPRGNYSYGATGDYFQAMGFELIEGRFLTSADSRRAQRVCVVDKDFARYYWPHGSALGQHLFQGSSAGPEAESFTVVGVVGSIKQAGLTDDSAQGAVYYPYIYRPDSNIFVALRGGVRARALGRTLESSVRRIDPELAVNDVQTMDERISQSLITRRSPALLAGAFSAIALLLTAIGTYGVLSYAVSQRTREIGVRMALGAQPEHIRAQFLSIASRLFLCGAAAGFVGGWLASKGMQTVLFRVSGFNMAVFSGAAGVLAVVCFAACWLPARRAARVSPVQALAAD